MLAPIPDSLIALLAANQGHVQPAFHDAAAAFARHHCGPQPLHDHPSHHGERFPCATPPSSPDSLRSW